MASTRAARNGRLLALFPTVETITAQALAATAVIASYLLAEQVRVRRPQRAGLAAAVRPERPPVASSSATR